MNCSICNLPTANVVGSVLPQCVCGWQKPSTPSTKHEWVGLTDEEIDQGLLRSPYALQSAGAWRDGVRWAEEILNRRNT